VNTVTASFDTNMGQMTEIHQRKNKSSCAHTFKNDFISSRTAGKVFHGLYLSWGWREINN